MENRKVPDDKKIPKICEAYTQWNRRCGLQVDSCSNFCRRHEKKSYSTCEICYNNMYVPTKLACGHTFCKNCIYRWSSRGSSCPMCRKDMFFINHSKDVIIKRAQRHIRNFDLTNPSCRDIDETCETIEFLLQNEWLDAFDKEYKDILTSLISSCDNSSKPKKYPYSLSVFRKIIADMDVQKKSA